MVVPIAIGMVDITDYTEVVELVDTHVSGACVARHEGSSPSFGTHNYWSSLPVPGHALAARPPDVPEGRYVLVFSIEISYVLRVRFEKFVA